MCFNFLTGRTGPSMGPQSSADKAAGGYVPPKYKAKIESKQTADRNTVRRADSYGGAPKRGDETKPGAWGGSTNVTPTNKLTPAPVNVPGAEKIKQTFQQPTNNAKNAKRIADRTVLKAKKRLPVPKGATASYWKPFKSWQGTTSRSGKTILGA